MSDEFQNFLKDLRSRTDIVEVVESYNIDLKRAGIHLKACCPFHNEKTPSFFVHPDRQSYRCYGCDVGGDAISFVMKYENLEFYPAIEILARRYGLTVPATGKGRPRDAEEDRRRESGFQALEMGAEFFSQSLLSDPAARDAIAYLQERKVSRETAQTFRLGFAPATWDAILKEGQRRRFTVETLETVGLVQPRTSGQGYRDRFHNRLIFPICDPQGRVVAFGGRALAPEDTPKYLNSPETPFYHKHQVLYGLHLARREIGKRREAFLVEGYFDAIALHQHGFANTVATCGTALTDDQARMLRRLCDSIIFLYDADAAGQKAMARGCEVLIGHDFSIRVATLTAGEDPDSYLQKYGAAAFETFLSEKARDFFPFLVDFALEQQDDPSVQGRTRVVEALAPVIAKAPNLIARHEYIRRLAHQLSLNEGDVEAYFAQLEARAREKAAHPSAPSAGPAHAAPSPPSAGPVADRAQDPYEAWERHVLWFALHDASAREAVAEQYQPELFLNPWIAGLLEKAFEHHDRQWTNLPDMQELADREEERRLLADIVTAAREHEAGYAYADLPAVDTARELMVRLRRVYLRRNELAGQAELARLLEREGDAQRLGEIRDEVHDHSCNRVQLYDQEYRPLPSWSKKSRE